MVVATLECDVPGISPGLVTDLGDRFSDGRAGIVSGSIFSTVLRFATAFLKDGRYFGASADHYSTGSYEFAGDSITWDAHSNQYGKVRAVYGSKKRQIDVRFEGKLKKEDKIVGRAQATDSKKFELKTRLIRLGDVD